MALNSFIRIPQSTFLNGDMPSFEWQQFFIGLGADSAPYSYIVPITGFSFQIPSGIEILILSPSGALSSGTVTLTESPSDGQIIKVASSKNITSFALLAASGQTVSNAPAALLAGVDIEFIFVRSVATWYRLR